MGLAPLAGASTSYQLAGGVLYTLDGNANRRTTTAWSLNPVRRRWSVSTPLQLDASGTVIHDDAATLARAGDQLLESSAAGTTVIDPATGRIRWSTAMPLVTGGGSSAVVQDAEFAAGTVYDQSSGAPGPLYFSADGVPHTRPPERTVLRGLELATGRERWRPTAAGSVDPGPGRGTRGARGGGFGLRGAGRRRGRRLSGDLGRPAGAAGRWQRRRGARPAGPADRR